MFAPAEDDNNGTGSPRLGLCRQQLLDDGHLILMCVERGHGEIAGDLSSCKRAELADDIMGVATLHSSRGSCGWPTVHHHHHHQQCAPVLLFCLFLVLEGWILLRGVIFSGEETSEERRTSSAVKLSHSIFGGAQGVFKCLLLKKSVCVFVAVFPSSRGNSFFFVFLFFVHTCVCLFCFN